MTEMLKINGLSFSYGGQKVLDGVDLEVKGGEFIAVLGHNGAGKSTLVKLVLGLLQPKAGKIKLFGQDSSEFRQWEKIGYVQQNKDDLDFEFPASVEEIVLMGRLKAKKGAFKSYTKEDYENAKKALEAVGAWELKSKKLGSLSGGQRQRVFLAQALASQSRLLVLDEPTSAMDYASQHAFYDTLLELNEQGLGILLITHDIGQVLQHAKRIIVINRKIVFDGNPKQLTKEELLEIMERI